MNILVLNGSPKGKYSITLQTSLYLQKKFPNYNFKILNIGKKIKALENDFTEARELITNADLLIFSYPVYTFTVPSQLVRFIELLKKEKLDLKNKYATQISTSKHFYDVTAHEFIKENINDLELKYIKGLSEDMNDLLTAKGQEEAVKFFDFVMWNIDLNRYEKPIINKSNYQEKNIDDLIEVEKDKDKDIVIITDATSLDVSLNNMILNFRKILPYKTRIVNINEYPFSGGCLGCFDCAVDGKCIYKDGFDEFLRNDIQKSDAIIYAFKIKDHFMGSRFKMYDDRQFCNGHRTVTKGTPMGYIISGDYQNEKNLQLIIKGRSEVGGNLLIGVATDGTNPTKEIQDLALMLDYSFKNKLTFPQNFLGVGGMKIFRDLIYQMRGMMKADHKFFKSNGQYDFPQRNKSLACKMYLVGALLSSKKIKSKIGNIMNDGMIAPYQKVINNTKSNK